VPEVTSNSRKRPFALKKENLEKEKAQPKKWGLSDSTPKGEGVSVLERKR